MLRQGMRFVLVGGFNTVTTYAIYCVLVIWWHPQLAWLTVFMIGLAMGYVLHTRVAFEATLAWHKALSYLVAQLIFYGISSGVIHIGIVWLGLGPRVAAALAIALNVPLSFALSRRVLSDPPPAPDADRVG